MILAAFLSLTRAVHVTIKCSTVCVCVCTACKHEAERKQKELKVVMVHDDGGIIRNFILFFLF